MPINPAAYEQLSPADKAEVAAALALLDSEAKANPFIHYDPHPKQVELHEARENIRAFLGGNRSGKTTAGVVDDLIQAVDAEVLPERLRKYKKWNGRFYCRIVVPDFQGTLDVILEKIREWCPASQLHGGSFDTAYSDRRHTVRFTNGSWFQFLTFEQDLDKFGGAALHRVHYDEEPPEDIRKECRARLIDFGGDELFTMTPLNGMTWMNDEIYEKRHNPGIYVVTVSTDENPHLDQAAMAEFFASLTEEERRARKDGRFVHFGGLVYHEFQDSDHVVPAFRNEDIASLDHVVTIDPGVRNTAISYSAFDRDNVLCVFDEIHIQDATIDVIAKLIHEKNRSWQIKPQYLIDPAGRQRNQTGENVETAFARHKIYCAHANNSVEAGIFEVKRRLQSEPPILTVSEACTRLIWEFGRYRHAKSPDGSFKVIKKDDHMLDTVRYTAMHRPWLGALPSRKEPPSARGYATAYIPNYDPRLGRLPPPRGSATNGPHVLNALNPTPTSA